MNMTVRTFAFAIGVLYLALAVLGFMPMFTTAAPDVPGLSLNAFNGYLFGVLGVNYFLNLVHMASGAWGVAASRGAGGSRAYAKTIAVLYGALAIMATMPQWKTVFGLMPLNGADVVLHAATAIVAAFFGWVWRTRATTLTQKPALR
jgi:hypothetical protein